MTEDIIAAMKELIRCYDECNSSSSTNSEVTYWRNRYLNSLPKYEDFKKAAYIWNNFLSMPSGYFIKFTPETAIAQIEEAWRHFENK